MQITSTVTLPNGKEWPNPVHAKAVWPGLPEPPPLLAQGCYVVLGSLANPERIMPPPPPTARTHATFRYLG